MTARTQRNPTEGPRRGTTEYAIAVLGAETVARIHADVAEAGPISEEGIATMRRIFGPHLAAREAAALAEVGRAAA